MTTITQAQRDQMAEDGLIDGEKPKRKLAGLKRPQAPAPIAEPVEAPVAAAPVAAAPATNVVVNNIDDKTIHKILEQNAALIKQMAVQLKSMAPAKNKEVSADQKAVTFYVKRDARGMIESVEAKYK